jgi:phospholipid-translocating ATPase
MCVGIEVVGVAASSRRPCCLAVVRFKVDVATRSSVQVPAITTWAPLGVVFAISAIKEGVDDLRRRKHDRAANERPYTVVTGGTRKTVQSQQIRVGDVVLVHKDSEVPCDLFLLNAWDMHGVSTAVCTLETANLDGETNWKHRRVCSVATALHCCS